MKINHKIVEYHQITKSQRKNLSIDLQNLNYVESDQFNVSLLERELKSRFHKKPEHHCIKTPE